MPTIVFSSQCPAGKNIAEKLIRWHGFGKREKISGFEAWKKGEVLMIEIDTRLVYADFLDEKINTDLFIFASKHKSESGTPCLTAHTPGNWGSADLGGAPKTLARAAPHMLKRALQKMNARAQEERLGWMVCAEVTHHGPTLSTPSLFVEIGSTENEWKNERAGRIIADSIMGAIGDEKQFEYAFGVGGTHYAPAFTKIILESELALGHILPKYQIDNVDMETFKHGIEKSEGRAGFVLLDWKGMNKGQREKIIKMCDEIGVKWKKTSEF
ncbi:MAG: D-aminoacyl-tRNA deacylase [Candidatus Micrarchaeota archaeon]